MSDDTANPVFNCSSTEELIVYSHSFPRALPTELKFRFREGFFRLLAAHNNEEVFRIINGKRLHEILTIVDQLSDPKIIASGQVNGMPYTLYEQSQGENDS